MRFLIALFMALGLAAASGVVVPSELGDTTSVAFAQQPSGQVEVDIDAGGDGEWWANPLWIGVGVLVLIAIIAIIAAAMRGGGTTIVKE